MAYHIYVNGVEVSNTPSNSNYYLKTGTQYQVVPVIDLSDYQQLITLTTTGTSEQSTFKNNVLNIPVYSGNSGGGDGTITGATNGLSVIGKNIALGGTLTGDTFIVSNTSNVINLGYTYGYLGGFNVFTTGKTTNSINEMNFDDGQLALYTGNDVINTNFSLYNDTAIFQNTTSASTSTLQINSSSFSFINTLYQESIQINGGAGINLTTSQGVTINNAGVSGANQFAMGNNSVIQSTTGTSVAIGDNVSVESQSFAFGNNVTVNPSTDYSFAFGNNIFIKASNSFAGGLGYQNNRIIAGGIASFNFSTNTSAQTLNYGANAEYSAILAGINHNIPITAYRSVVLGGNAIKVNNNITDTVHLPKLRIGLGLSGSLPNSGATSILGYQSVVKGEVSNVSIKSGLSLSSNQLSVTGMTLTTTFNTYTATTAPNTFQKQITLTTTGTSGVATFVNGHLNITNYYVLQSYTVSTLPSSPTTGQMAMVSDASSPSYLSTIVGGGSTKTPVFYNGSNWVAH